MATRTLTQLTRMAEQVIARQARIQRAPRVLWANLDETEEAFTIRAAELQNSGAHMILAAVPHGFQVPAGVRPVEFPWKLFVLLHPSTPSRYRAASGGRGSGKSHAIAAAIVLRMLARKMRILCAREIQRSLRESVHHLLTEKIEQLGCARYFSINDREIACTVTGAEIIFAGLMTNVQQLKSLEGVALCWIEESESVSSRSFEVLTPTIRAAGSEIWLSCNPDAPDAPVQGFLDGSRPDVRHEHVTWSDNPWFPPELEAERVYLQGVDDDAYQHIWEGRCRTHSDAQVFRGKYAVQEFTADPFYWSGPYFGADWGFSQDPTTLVRCWILDKVLYVDHEAYALGCDLDRTPALFDTVPGAQSHVVRADCARPESISYLQRHGYPAVKACEKWSGSVEDGIAHIRSYERVIIHPRCEHLAEEMRLYSYKVDKLTRDVMPDLVDRHNHCIDALRYALEPLIRNAGQWVFGSLGRGSSR